LHILLVILSRDFTVRDKNLSTLNSSSKIIGSRRDKIILGTPLKYFPKISFTGNIYVIQGENDKNGGVKEVKEAFNNLDQNKIKYFEIPGADHSFRDPETKDPIFQEKALEILSTIKKILQNRKSAN